MAIPIGILMSSYRIVERSSNRSSISFAIFRFRHSFRCPSSGSASSGSTRYSFSGSARSSSSYCSFAGDMRRVPNEFVKVARTLGANSGHVMGMSRCAPWRPRFWNVCASARLCWTYVIIAEIVAADSGIGYIIWTARRFVKTPEVIAGVVVIS